MIDTTRDMIQAIHAILTEDLSDAETIEKIREVLYGKEPEEDEETDK